VPEAAADTAYIRSTFPDAGRAWLKKDRERSLESALEQEGEV
jgi:hypothetical protein